MPGQGAAVNRALAFAGPGRDIWAMIRFLTTPEGRRIAHHLTPGQGVPVAFLGGFRSDMTGTKALALQAWADRQGRPVLRFDYSGHGASSGRFEEGAIGDWLADARAALALLPAPRILVGSSMGGWLALLLAREAPDQVAGLVTIAAAPDFTDWAYQARLDAAQAADLERQGWFAAPSDYGEPYRITRRLLVEGAAHRILDRPLTLPMPVRMLQGSADTDVPPAIAQRLFDHARGPDIRLTLVKGADHRFSTPECLSLITATVETLPL
jgi:pimeloyl-ACP methyl ester carboxylesterase